MLRFLELTFQCFHLLLQLSILPFRLFVAFLEIVLVEFQLLLQLYNLWLVHEYADARRPLASASGSQSSGIPCIPVAAAWLELRMPSPSSTVFPVGPPQSKGQGQPLVPSVYHFGGYLLNDFADPFIGLFDCLL